MKKLFTLLFLIISTYSYAYQANLSINPNISQFTNDSGYALSTSTINAASTANYANNSELLNNQIASQMTVSTASYSTNSDTARNVSVASQPAITSVGTLTGLNVNDDVIIVKNNRGLIGKTTGAVARYIAYLGSDDKVGLGDSNLATVINGTTATIAGGLNVGNASGAGSGGIKATMGDFSGMVSANYISLTSGSATANGSVLCVFTAASGPTGSSTTIQGWIKFMINGVQHFMPYW